MFIAHPVVAWSLLGLVAVAGLGGSDANAQQIFRIVGPDGRVTFSDKPPLEGSGRASLAPVISMATPSSEVNTLPFELRQATTRYPVAFYTAPGCAPCDAGRSFLSGRGIPFLERTVTSNEDIDALKRLAGAPSLPFLTIGGQQLKGFSEVEWMQFLDAAGYPKSSQLPVGYTRAPVTPLVAAQQPQAQPAPRIPTPRASATGSAAPDAVPAESSTGIRF